MVTPARVERRGTLRLRRRITEDGELWAYRDLELENEHATRHYGDSWDEHHCNGQPMVMVKPSWDDVPGEEHLACCPVCTVAPVVIVVGGDSDGVWERTEGRHEDGRLVWRRLDEVGS